MQCQYINPRTGERCDLETNNWIAVGPVRLPVCEGEHAKAMAPGGRNRAQMQRDTEEYERHMRHQAEARGAAAPLPTSTSVSRGSGIIWPNVEK